MPRAASKNPRAARSSAAALKYDANHKVIANTYGALAELRRELSDSKEKVAERTNVLKLFSSCADSQRAWLILEDYFEKLNLSRKDFIASEIWWPKMITAVSKARLEELAMLFLRSSRPLPGELSEYANFARFAEIEEAEKEQKIFLELENWLFPPSHAHLDGPR